MGPNWPGGAYQETTGEYVDDGPSSDAHRDGGTEATTRRTRESDSAMDRDTPVIDTSDGTVTFEEGSSDVRHIKTSAAQLADPRVSVDDGKDVAAVDSVTPVRDGCPSRAAEREQVAAPAPKRRLSRDEMISDAPAVPDGGPRRGWRRWARSLSFGLITPGLSAAEKHERRMAQCRRDIAMTFRRPHVVTFANDKGGSGKTPTAIHVAGTFGRERGQATLFWDNDESTGSSADRLESSGSSATIAELLGSMDRFGDISTRAGDLAGFFRRQEAGRFDALISSRDAALMLQIDDEKFRRVYEVLERFYPVMALDSGNVKESSNYLASIEHTDVIVIPLKWQTDHVSQAMNILEHLYSLGRDDLAENAIIVVTHGRGDDIDLEQKGRWEEQFTAATRGVFTIPYDPHIGPGKTMRFDRLQQGTREAYLELSAEIARAFKDSEIRGAV